MQSAEPHQDQQLGEAREAVDDESAVEGGGLVGRRANTIAPAATSSSDTSQETMLVDLSPRDHAGISKRHGADRQDQFGQQDDEIGVQVHLTAPWQARCKARRVIDGQRGLVFADQIVRPTPTVTSNTGLG